MTEKAKLSPKEETIVKEIANHGYTNKELTKKLLINPKNLEFIKSKIYEKIEVKNTAQLVKYACLQGWIKKD